MIELEIWSEGKIQRIPVDIMQYHQPHENRTIQRLSESYRKEFGEAIVSIHPPPPPSPSRDRDPGVKVKF